MNNRPNMSGHALQPQTIRARIASSCRGSTGGASARTRACLEPTFVWTAMPQIDDEKASNAKRSI